MTPSPSFRDSVLPVPPSSSSTSAPVQRATESGMGRIAFITTVAISFFAFVLCAGLFVVDFVSNGGVPKNMITLMGMVILPFFLGIFIVLGSKGRFQQVGRSGAHDSHLPNRGGYREDLLRLVANHQPGAMAIFDRYNRYWFVNEQAARDLGQASVADVLGKSPSAVMDGERAKRLEVRLAEARAGTPNVTHLDRVIDGKGTTKFIQSRYQAVAPFAELVGGVLVSEEDQTSLIVERERRETTLRQVIGTLVAVVDRRDPYASGHSARVGQLARVIAEEMGLDARHAETAEIAGSLMNFGKVLISRSVLTKTTPLTPDELQRIRDSILVSADILSIIGFEGPVVPTLRQVMERYDGTGLPQGLRGDSIMLTARIVAVANTFVALVSPRAHRDGMPFPTAIAQLNEGADTIYDRKVLLALSHYIENRPNKLDWLMASRPPQMASQ